ncbi:MAG: MOSC N-terminal beta barrel domain-containing protein [Ramlibacter sp.]|nr:MOSC N-terminal beta barrel domain-containing protein [Ramlibacter sp.]
MTTDTPDVTTRIARIFVYPVKSCAGVELTETVLTETGLDLDRAWMVVDEHGEFMSQRELPRMALVKVQLKHSEVVLRAPGMLALHLSIEAVEEPTRVRLWGDELRAYDMGSTAAQWFTDFLGQKLRLARFDPDERRASNRRWTGEVEALNQFSDGYPILVVSEGSLAELNRRLEAAGKDAVGMERFRPNIVLAGLDPHDEDRLDVMTIGEDGAVQLRGVKPCPRCPIPDVDPATGEVARYVSDTLQAYRSNPVVDGAVSFGMNMVTVKGFDEVLRVGQPVTADWRFD